VELRASHGVVVVSDVLVALATGAKPAIAADTDAAMVAASAKGLRIAMLDIYHS
jgi:hypothetical protein